MDGSRILIFMDTKKGCDQITRQLRMDGWPALSIHGDKSQAERDWVLSEFKAGKSPIMTATDVAARGLGMYKTCMLRGTLILRAIFKLSFPSGMTWSWNLPPLYTLKGINKTMNGAKHS